MQQVFKLIPRGQGLAAVIVKRSPCLELDWDLRQKSRFDASTTEGVPVGVFLPRGTVIRGGDVLLATDGALIRVLAAPQPVLRIAACPKHGHGAFDLMRAAYHLGNRHVPIELKPDHLRIEPDHVLAAMLGAMHLNVQAEHHPFEPESGAYGQANSHSHAHGHVHAHDHGPQQGAASKHAHP